MKIQSTNPKFILRHIKMETTDLDFCYLLHDRPISKGIISKIKKAYKINRDFWKQTLPKFKIQLVYTREEMNKAWSSNTEKWFIAFAWDKIIFIFSPEVIEKVTSHKKRDFESTLVHEINHLFYQNITKTYKPLWLSEGIAINLEKRDRKKINLNELRKLNHSDFYTFENRNIKMMYLLSFYSVKLLLKKGKTKIIKLIKLYSEKITESNFERSFLKVYGFKVKELWDKLK